jgi:tetratricopeptide (TPR) repeat protein
MAHLMRGWLQAASTDPASVDAARADLALASLSPLNERESAHLQALAQFCAGQWAQASTGLCALSERWPRDALALQVGHLIDFLRGDGARLHARIADALPHWGPGDASHGPLLGMLAFGREEAGDYAGALAAGEAALAAQPRDAWAHHAVAHVHEMRGDARRGVDWMREREAHWAEDSFLAVHNWWHLALFHLDLGDIDAAHALLDGPVRGTRSLLAVNLVDGSALAWRLQLMGVDVGTAWQSLAADWATVGRPGCYSFNDFHAMLAWVGAGDGALAQRWLQAQTVAAAAQVGDHAELARLVGRPLLQAQLHLAEGQPAAALTELQAVWPQVQRFGGSHAQRDLVELMRVDAALQAGDGAEARRLIAARLSRKPASVVNLRLAERCETSLSASPRRTTP